MPRSVAATADDLMSSSRSAETVRTLQRAAPRQYRARLEMQYCNNRAGWHCDV
jgi:hypothetical protein